MRRILLGAAIAASFIPLQSQAQQVTGPQAGTWGAETGAGAALLRFRSPTSAWVLGANATFRTEDVSGNTIIAAPENFVNVAVRLGARRYRNEGQAFRPFHTIGVITSYRSSGIDEIGGGLFFELGAVQFFSRHLSLGASGAVDVQYAQGKYELSSGDATTRSWMLNANLIRVHAAIYF